MYLAINQRPCLDLVFPSIHPELITGGQLLVYVVSFFYQCEQECVLSHTERLDKQEITATMDYTFWYTVMQTVLDSLTC